MCTVINGATRFRRVMDRAEVLPFRGAHLWASILGAGWTLVEEGHNDVVFVDDEKATELIEPKQWIDTVGFFDQ